ncbi:ROK family transcriptional regulator [Nocardioides speluncae]|uniref:ROK family transcriptional regulator n=1 Tax=Nocardioides speluncae TaxID=2670337 RepID=UPI000D6983DC|nr:ROK family transcriptional regulator [Nocardioides speluncae]
MSESALGSPGAILDLVRTGRASTRSDLGRLTGLSRTAVVSRVEALQRAGFLMLGAELASTGGRPPSGLVFNRDAGVVAAAAVGRSRSQVALFDLLGSELDAAAVDHEVGASPDAVMPVVAEQLARLLGDRRTPVLGVGLSLPGAVDVARGVGVDSPAMAGWDGVELAPYLAEVAPAPLYVGNDADLLARSELLAHGDRYRDLLVVKASTGLGLGIVADGRVVSGHRGGAGEIGHTKVEAAAGNQCRCGDIGCVETIAGGWALVARLRDSQRPVGHIRELVALALDGDPEAKHLLRESGRLLGDVLAVAVNLTNPEAVVLGGDMAAAFDVYAAGVRESLYARACAPATRELTVLPSSYGERAGLVGCAALALEHVLSPAAVEQRVSATQSA